MTILGKHTAHELGEMLDNFDSFAASLAAAKASGWAIWSANDPSAADDWSRDYDSFVARYTPASRAARGTVDGAKASLLGWDGSTAEPEYNALLFAYKPSDGDPTSLPDLDRRWRAAAAAPPPVYHPVQPTAPDADLGAYQAADAAAKEIDALGAQAKAALPSQTKLLVGAAAAALVLLLVARVVK